jgi:hypothetical protein
MYSEVAATYENGVLKLDRPLSLADGERVLVRTEPLASDVTPKVFYHYCSVDAFLGIIRDGLFRLSNLWFMNDSKEVRWFYGIALEIAGDRLDKLEFGSDPSDAAKEYLQTLKRNLEKRPDFDHVYCGCFSAKPDDLSQWRGYADEGRGLAIGFDLGEICALPENKPGVLRCVDVEYCEEEQRKKAESVVEEFGSPSKCAFGNDPLKHPRSQAWKAYYDLSRFAPRCKNPSFRSEEETRVILHPSNDSSFRDPILDYRKSVARFPAGEVEFRFRGERIIPYVTITVPRTSIKEIVFGPRFGGQENHSALRLVLVAHGIDLASVKIWPSTATYRG